MLERDIPVFWFYRVSSFRFLCYRDLEARIGRGCFHRLARGTCLGLHGHNIPSKHEPEYNRRERTLELEPDPPGRLLGVLEVAQTLVPP